MKPLNIKATIVVLSLSLPMLTACNSSDNLKDTNASNEIQSNTNQDQTTSDSSTNGYSYSDSDLDSSWNENNAIKINLSNYKTGSLGSGVKAEFNNIKITSAGTYVLEGNLKNGQIIIDAQDTDKIQLVLNNAEINCNDNAPIYIKNADKVFLTLADGSTNIVSDGEKYNSAEEGVDAAIFSNDDLTINGTGKLNVKGNFENAIKSDDTLVITDGDIDINSKNNGITGNDEIAILDGKFNIVAGQDAIKSRNKIDLDKGNTFIDGGEFNIAAVDDGIEAQRVLIISNTPKITISKSTEGLESEKIYIKGGTIDITSQDDAINASSPDDAAGDCDLVISRGEITVNAQGDGLDSNGNLLVEGGTTLVYGPTNDGNGSIDYDGEGKINGGTLISIGSSGMYQGFSDDSEQASISVTYTTEQNSGKQLTLTDEDGNIVASFKTVKNYQSLLISSPKIKVGNKYKLYSEEPSNDSKAVITEGKIGSGEAVVEITASTNLTNVNEKGEAVTLRQNGPGRKPGGQHGGNHGDNPPPQREDMENMN